MTTALSPPPSSVRALPQRAVAALAGVLAAAFVLAAIYGVIGNYSPVPFWDMWDGYLGFYVRQLTEPSAWWSQHNEHRIALSRVLFWMDIRFFGGNSVVLIATNLLLALTTFGLLAASALRLPSLQRIERVALAAVIVGFGLAWTQKNNLTWGFQSQFFLAYLLPLAALLALERSCHARTKRGWWFAGALSLATLSAGSMANGVLAMPLVAVAMTLSRQGMVRVLCAWGLAIATVALYFRDYVSPAGHGSLSASLLGDPAGVVVYLVAYLGAPFAYITDPATVVPALLAGTFVALGAASFGLREILQRRRISVDLRFALALFLAYVVASALAVAASRQGFGLESAYSSRYTTPALLALSTTLLLAIEPMLHRVAGARTWVVGALLVPLVALAPEQMRALRIAPYEGFERMVAALAIEMRVRDDDQIRWIFPSTEWVMQIAQPAANADLSIFRHPAIHDAGLTLGARFPDANAIPECGGVVGVAAPIAASPVEKVQGALLGESLPPEIGPLFVVDQSDRVVGRGLLAAAAVDASGNRGAPFRAYLQRERAPGPLRFISVAGQCNLAAMPQQGPQT